MESMKTLPIRLTPGQDLRTALEAAVLAQNCRAAFVLSGIGSLSTAVLRLAGAEQPTVQVLGGHVAPGCIVRTTAEVLLALLSDWQFTRESDAITGYDELVIRARS